MKRLILIIVSVLICGICFLAVSSCSKESNANNSTLNIKAVGFLGEPSTRSSFAEGGAKIDTLLFKGDNIEWYNETTSEIKFKNNPDVNYFWNVYGGLVSIIVCLDEVELFTLDAISAHSSVSLNHPVLIRDPEGLYIGRGYPNWEYRTEKFWTETGWNKETEASWVNDREKNWKAIEPGWNIFIEQLKKEGKYQK